MAWDQKIHALVVVAESVRDTARDLGIAAEGLQDEDKLPLAVTDPFYCFFDLIIGAIGDRANVCNCVGLEVGFYGLQQSFKLAPDDRICRRKNSHYLPLDPQRLFAARRAIARLR